MTFRIGENTQLRRKRKIDELRQELVDIRDSVGAKHLVYHIMPDSGSLVEGSIVLATYSQEWVDRYLMNQYVEIDPVIDLAGTANAPVDWVDFRGTSPQVDEFFADAEKHGVGMNGVTIPILAPWSGRVILSVTSSASDESWSRRTWAEMRPMLRVANLVHRRLFCRAMALRERPLTRRETECLTILRHGGAPKQAASAMGISENRVRAILHNAASKLGCRTPVHTVVRAIELGYIA